MSNKQLSYCRRFAALPQRKRMEGTMNFFEAISSGFRNYVGFSGRAIRSEYWYWVLFTILLSIVTVGIDFAIFMDVMATSGISPVNTIASLAVLLPTLAVTIRRLHDRDQTGWWILLGLIPLIGAIILIVWFCMRGTVGPNRFGPDPLEGKF
jgi:uncharacterized membrane protein YhaH (DUF805 family)